MGAIQNALIALGSIFGMGLAYLVLQPFFDYGTEYMRAMGGHAAEIAGLIDTVLTIFPYLFTAVILIWFFIMSTKEEDNTQWN
nr:hypothetical protein [uncultured Methanomethylovorans sp.]